jgi:hypothetical protein
MLVASIWENRRGANAATKMKKPELIETFAARGDFEHW